MLCYSIVKKPSKCLLEWDAHKIDASPGGRLVGFCLFQLRFRDNLSSIPEDGFNFKVSSKNTEPLPHACEPYASGRSREIETNAQVSDFQNNRIVGPGQLHKCVSRVAVFDDVVERLLRDPENT